MNNRHSFLTRREMLLNCANGFGAVALAALLAEEGRRLLGQNAPAPVRHHPPRCSNVIFLYMDGGPSQVDTFDYKPMLERYHGRDPHSVFKVEPTQFNNVGKVMASPWKFRRCGQSGQWVSDLFPHLAECVDDLCFIRSMVSKFPEHTSANYFLHTGSGIQGRPSMGAWVSYGLGSENKQPARLHRPQRRPDSARRARQLQQRLPARPRIRARSSGPPIRPSPTFAGSNRPTQQQRGKLDLLRRLDDRHARTHRPSDDAIESAIANYETAYRMQTAVPELDGHHRRNARRRGSSTASTPTYAHTRTFGRQCLIARRLVERGARFIELTCPNVGARSLGPARRPAAEATRTTARAVDQPIAGLLKDLKARGLLDSTLVVWAGEFGRTPFAQGSDGRDHNQFGFTIWLAGGGVKRRHGLRRNRRMGLQGRRGQGRNPRSARHHAAPAGHRSHAADVSLRRPRHAA